MKHKKGQKNYADKTDEIKSKRWIYYSNIKLGSIVLKRG